VTDHYVPCEVIEDASLAAEPFCIPGCWPCVLSGDHDDCTCEGSPNAIAMDRRWRAWQRLVRMREHRAQRESADLGLHVLPGVTSIEHSGAPIVRVPLRVVG
jgi:hypothetical protein